MRRLLIGMVVTATTALLPMLALADNQQVAERIAANLRNSGQMHDYKIGVKFQDGTAWLRGRVTSEEQIRTALRLASETPGVQRVENELTAATTEPPAPARRGMLVNPFGGSAVQPASADMPVQPLQQGSGATAPEQFPRTIASSLGITRSQPVERAPAIESGPALSAPEPVRRVPASFAPMPVTAVAAEEPTLAPQPTAPQPIPMAQPPMQAVQQRMPMAQPAPAMRPMAAPRPMPVAYAQGAPAPIGPAAGGAPPVPAYAAPASGGVAPVRYDQPHMPNYAWPSYAAYPNYAAVTYPKQYSPTAWPYIGPFYPYPQVPLGWRKVSLEWHDGWWFLDFDDGASDGPLGGLFKHR